jgi:hypothetical protein
MVLGATGFILGFLKSPSNFLAVVFAGKVSKKSFRHRCCAGHPFYD